jgi:hypothetical protein
MEMRSSLSKIPSDNDVNAPFLSSPILGLVNKNMFALEKIIRMKISMGWGKMKQMFFAFFIILFTHRKTHTILTCVCF